MTVGIESKVVAALALSLIAALAHPAPAQTAPSAQCSRSQALESHLSALAQMPQADVHSTLRRIDGTGRKLLALRSYLRAQDSLAARWSWKQTEIDAYLQSDQHRDMLAEVDRIKSHFEAANPGFTLFANTDVRSLDLQIQRWNENVTVAAMADDLYRAACLQVASSLKVRTSQRRFGDFLVQWTPELPAPLAAPGLSLHGRARAVDFQVQKGDEAIAWPDTTTIQSVWVADGWARRLNASIKAASAKFDGPLTMPVEPWHFEYKP